MDGRSDLPRFVEIGQVPHLPLGRSEGSERSKGSSLLRRASSGKAASADVRAPSLSRFGWVAERRNDDESSAHPEEGDRDALDESNRSNVASCFAACFATDPPFAALADEDTTLYSGHSHSSAGSLHGDEDKLAEIAALEKRLRQLKAEAATERANNHPAKEDKKEEAVEVGWEEREDSHHFFVGDGKPPLIASISKPRQFNEQPEIDNCSVVSGAISLPDLGRNATTESTHVECQLANKDVSIAIEEREVNAKENALEEEGNEETEAAKDDVAVLSIQGDVPVEAVILEKPQGGAGSAVQHSAWYEADKGEWSVPTSVSIDPNREGTVESWSTATLPSINSRTKKVGPAVAVKRLLSAVQRNAPIPEEISFIEQTGTSHSLGAVAEDECEAKEENGEELITLAVWQPRKHCETMHLRRGRGH